MRKCEICKHFYWKDDGGGYCKLTDKPTHLNPFATHHIRRFNCDSYRENRQ